MGQRYTLEPLPPKSYRISVVLPVFSETETVRDVVTWHRNHLGDRLEEIVIVLSPRSQPASRQVCEELVEEDPRVRLHIQQQNPGLGRAVREGLERVRGNLVLLMDSDGEMEIETVPRMLEAMERGNCGLVVASRWLKGGGFAGYSPVKYMLNWAFQQLFRALYQSNLHDLTYGFKLIRAELARDIDWSGTLHEIACETTLKPLKLGVAVAEVPSKWTARVQGASKNTFMRNFRYVDMAWTILTRGVPLQSRRTPVPAEPVRKARRPAARATTSRDA